jgi:hypothetical protein
MAGSFRKTFQFSKTKLMTLSSLFFSFILINFITKFSIILFLFSVLLSFCHINAVDDFLNKRTLLSPEPEQLHLTREHGKLQVLIS